MKRSMDLVRKILLAMNDHEDGYAPNDMGIEGHSEEEIGYHCLIMSEAGLIVASNTSPMSSTTPTAMPIRLTWAGHEFIDNAKNDRVWSQTKQALSKVGDVSFSVFASVLSKIVTQNLGLDS